VGLYACIIGLEDQWWLGILSFTIAVYCGLLFWIWTEVDHLAPCRWCLVTLLWLALSLMGGRELGSLIIPADSFMASETREDSDFYLLVSWSLLAFYV
jgi:uncharacterized membrane protein